VGYNGQFLKVSYQFVAVGSEEVADTAINLGNGAGSTSAVASLAELTLTDLEDLYDAYAAELDFATWCSWAGYSRLQSIKVAAIGVDGAYLTEPRVFEPSSGWSQGTTANVLPQSTVVLSLRSGFTLGGGNYGRMYLPHTSLGALTTEPRGTSASATTGSEKGAAFVARVAEVVNSTTTSTYVPVIMGQTGAGTQKEIAQVGVGRVTDTQRRRRNRLVEDYVFTAVP